MTFTPVDGYAGNSKVNYSVAGEDGSRATASVSVTIPPLSVITQNPAKGGRVPDTMPSGDRLVFTGIDILWPGLGASSILMTLSPRIALRRRRTARQR